MFRGCFCGSKQQQIEAFPGEGSAAASANHFEKARVVHPVSAGAPPQDEMPVGTMDPQTSHSGEIFRVHDPSCGGTSTDHERFIAERQLVAAMRAACGSPIKAQPGNAHRLAYLQQLVRRGDERPLIKELSRPFGSNREGNLDRAADAYDLLTWECRPPMWECQPPMWAPATHKGTVNDSNMATQPASPLLATVGPAAHSISLSGTAPLLGAYSLGLPHVTFCRDQEDCLAMAALLCQQQLEVHCSVELAYNAKDRQVSLRLLDLACRVTNRAFGLEGIGHTPYRVQISAVPQPLTFLSSHVQHMHPLVDRTQHASGTAEDCELSAILQNDPDDAQVMAVLDPSHL